MDEFVSFVVENQMLIYAIICLLLLIVLVAFAPRKKKVKEELVDNSPKSTDDLTIEDVTDIVTQNIRSQHPGAAFVGTTPEDYMGIMKQLAPVACSSDNNTIEWIYK